MSGLFARRDGLFARRDGQSLVVDAPDGAVVAYSVSTSPDVPGSVWWPFAEEVRAPVPADATQGFVHLRRSDGLLDVAGERLIVLEGALNVRDLGGYQARDGRTVRWRRLYRGDNPGTLTDADLVRIAGLGLRTVVDFRSDPEVGEYGGRLGELRGVKLLRLPIAEHLVEQSTPLQRILNRELASFSTDDMAELYHRMLLQHAVTFGRVLQLAAKAGAVPLLFHCTGGKDRTGLTAALLLEVLGVDRTVVLDDYELTNQYRTDRRMAALGPRFEAAGIELEPFLALFGAPRPALIAALDRLDQNHGGVEGYLTGAAGVPSRAMAQLRDRLLVP